MIRLTAGCKINLGLRVLDLRPDGYHELNTLFYPISFPADWIEVEPAARMSLHCDNITCPAEKNLVWKAWEAFSSAAGKKQAYNIRLIKRIPAGAGLGGGSSDAACFLRWLNREGALSQKDLQGLAAGIGADVPFFLEPVPCLASGIGERLERIKFAGEGWHLVVVYNGIEISTPRAFRAWDKMPRNSLTKPICANTEIISVEALDIANDLEAAVCATWPRLATIRDDLLRSGALKAAMSGSGSAIYGIFSGYGAAARARSRLARKYRLVTYQPMRNFGMLPSG